MLSMLLNTVTSTLWAPEPNVNMVAAVPRVCSKLVEDDKEPEDLHQIVFPQEIVDEIILQSCKDKKALLSWSHVSRSCNITAIPHLFRSICIHVDFLLPGPREFAAFLDEYPRIASLVVRLRIVGHTGHPGIWSLDASSLSHVLEKLPNVQELYLRRVLLSRTDDKTIWPPNIASYKLRRLYIDIRECPGSGFHTWLQVISLFSHIDHLYLGQMHEDDDDEGYRLSHRYLLRISEITFAKPHYQIAHLCCGILRLEKSTLRSLTMVIRGQSPIDRRNVVQICRELGGSLRHLAIDLRFSASVPSAHDLQKLGQLESISFTFGKTVVHGSQWPFAINFLDGLPGTSLRSITLSLSLLPWEMDNPDEHPPLDDICDKFSVLENVRVCGFDPVTSFGKPSDDFPEYRPGTLYTQEDIRAIRAFFPKLDARGLLVFE